jgi:hypothetical protein
MGMRVEGIGRHEVGKVALPEIEIVIGDPGPDVGIDFVGDAHVAGLGLTETAL